MPYDTNTLLLLHFDGTNGSTAVVDTSGLTTGGAFGGGAALTTSNFKFGTASMAATGNLVFPNQADLALAGGDFTIEMWAYPVVLTPSTFPSLMGHLDTTVNGGIATFLNQSAGNTIGLIYSHTNASRDIINGDIGGWPSENAWHHIAWVLHGTNLTVYVDGSSIFSQTVTTPMYEDSTTTQSFGDSALPSGFCIDEVRISNIARYTTTFTPPTAPFTIGVTTVAVGASPNPVVPVTGTTALTATITVGGPGSPPFPTGTVEFYDGATLIGTQTLSGSSYTASMPYSSSVQGGHSITAVYSGDGYYAGNTSPGYTLAVTSTPYEALVLASNPIGYWRLNETTLDSNYADSSGNGLTGPSVFNTQVQQGNLLTTYSDSDGNSTVATALATNLWGGSITTSAFANVPTTGWTIEAWVNLTANPDGSQIITDGYNVTDVFALCFSTGGGTISPGGDLLFGGFYNGTSWVGVSASSPLTLNQTYHLAATWDGSNVRLYIDGVLIGTQAGSPYTVSASRTLFIGGNPSDFRTAPRITGRGSEVAIYGTALSGATILAHYDLGIQTGGGPTTTTLGVASNPVPINTTDVLTATVGYSGGPGPTGTVTFYDGATAIATVGLSGNTATYPASFSTATTHNLTAQYSGDGEYYSSTSTPAVGLVVLASQVSTTTSLAVLINPVAVGVEDTFVATVVGESPTGTVTFYANGIPIGAAALSAGTATITFAFASVGFYSVIAQYSGDGLNAPSSSTADPIVVGSTPSPGTGDISPYTSLVTHEYNHAYPAA